MWIAQALGGDRDAFACLVEKYQAAVFNLCHRMLGNAAEAEDAAQETFVRVYSRMRSYDPKQKLTSWILAVASHHCIDRLRRRRIRWLSLDQVEHSRQLAGRSAAAETTMLDKETQSEVAHLLQSLPADQRLVCVLRYWHELSYAEIAETVGSTEGAVKSRLHRARRMLASKLSGQDAMLLSTRPTPEAKRVRKHAVL